MSLTKEELALKKRNRQSKNLSIAKYELRERLEALKCGLMPDEEYREISFPKKTYTAKENFILNP